MTPDLRDLREMRAHKIIMKLRSGILCLLCKEDSETSLHFPGLVQPQSLLGETLRARPPCPLKRWDNCAPALSWGLRKAQRINIPVSLGLRIGRASCGPRTGWNRLWWSHPPRRKGKRKGKRTHRAKIFVTHLGSLHFGANMKALVLNGPPQRDTLLHRHLLALLPDYAHNFEVAEADDDRRHDEYVGRHEREVSLALRPSRVAATQAFVFNRAVGINAHRYLRSITTASFVVLNTIFTFGLINVRHMCTLRISDDVAARWRQCVSHVEATCHVPGLFFHAECAFLKIYFILSIFRFLLCNLCKKIKTTTFCFLYTWGKVMSLS